MFRYEQWRHEKTSIADTQEWRFQAWKRSYKCSVVLQVDRFADFQELRFQAAKYSDNSCVELQGCLFADCQECRF